MPLLKDKLEKCQCKITIEYSYLMNLAVLQFQFLKTFLQKYSELSNI